MLITADRVLTDSDTYLEDGAVLTDGETIIAVGLREEVVRQAPPDAEHISFSGTVMPGLIDAHVHLIFDGSPDPVAVLQATDEELLGLMRQRAERLLRTGVTTARDLGDRNGLAFRVAREIEAGSVSGPRILAAGAPATPPGGHCYFLGGEVAGETEIRDLVRRNAAAGAAVIKVMTSGGGLTKDGPRSWQSQFSREELHALVDEAHSAGLPVAAHAHGAEAITEAVAAGVDTLEHCTWMTETGFDLRHDVLQRIVDRNIAVSVTVSPHWRMLPKVFGEERAGLMFDQVRQMAEAGANVIIGTDAGVQRTGFDGLPGALTFYAHLGIPNSVVLAMATRRAAEALGLGGVTGRVAPGFRADLLLVDGDPLRDLEALQRVRSVISVGNAEFPRAPAGWSSSSGRSVSRTASSAA
ncbi:amidohydrolase family protein [Streptomyces rapamycinicus NRRL 5491]|nr:amidohydrolase family protein [Streptomyces rapamycinicus]UTO67838.1 amidohydrolase family protein [Streptomyces rapamycinicus]UTP37033.1 amidohydrolase family protein [Streptomyces rapamycinicus NRRL 5491]